MQPRATASLRKGQAPIASQRGFRMNGFPPENGVVFSCLKTRLKSLRDDALCGATTAVTVYVEHLSCGAIGTLKRSDQKALLR